MRCPRNSGPGWRIAVDLADAAGVDFPQGTAMDEVLHALAGSVRQYEGLDADGIGMLGVPGNVEAPAGT